ncbi:metallophosphoesterase family protein [Terriglobus sp. RCC_193]|uniref:metallophosphoesterase family protein n=1 Tax=Terriglobus sp. RCC_193 TaxID=3239218 RepID=UPI003526BFA1
MRDTEIMNDKVRVGVISDTHGLLRPEVPLLLEGVDCILHAGDVGDIHILHRLALIAPVTAIRGNVDTTGPCAALSATDLVEISGISIYMVHSIHDLDIKPEAAGVRIVVSGHTHKPAADERNGVLYLNPGSIGPRRFRLPVSLAILHLDGNDARVEFVTLDS